MARSTTAPLPATRDVAKKVAHRRAVRRMGPITAWLHLRGSLRRRLRTYGPAILLDVLAVLLAFETGVILRFIDTPELSTALRQMLLPSLLAAMIYAVVSYCFGLHRRLWRYASLPEALTLVQAVAVSTLLIGVLDMVDYGPLIGVASDIPMVGSVVSGAPSLTRLVHERPLPLGVVLAGAVLSLLCVGSVKILPRIAHSYALTRSSTRETRVLIVGAGLAGTSLLRNIVRSDLRGYDVVGFVDDDAQKWGRRLNQARVLGLIDTIPQVVSDLDVDLIAVAVPSAGSERISEILAICQETPAQIKILPSVHEMVGARAEMLSLREVNIADLLGRDVVPLHSAWAQTHLAGKTVVVTGAAGSIGSELCQQLLEYRPKRVIALDNNETGLFDLTASLRFEKSMDGLVTQIGDIRDTESMERLFAAERPYAVFHAAAYKHVPLLEHHPDQAVRTNVLATYHLCRLAEKYGVARFVFISTDKAADPVNVLGASKRMGEIAVQSFAQQSTTTRFCAVRFGNVIGSRGSVIPTFIQQIEHGGPVTVTDPRTTRYFMTIPEACGLVIVTAGIAGNGLYILDMGEPVLIADVASKIIRMRGLRVGKDIAIVYTGMRSGERLHEILADLDEELVATEHPKIFHVPPQRNVPSLSELEEGLRDLERALALGEPATVRSRLFVAVELAMRAPAMV